MVDITIDFSILLYNNTQIPKIAYRHHLFVQRYDIIVTNRFAGYILCFEST